MFCLRKKELQNLSRTLARAVNRELEVTNQRTQGHHRYGDSPRLVVIARR
jgi:hypothetical protein